METILLTGANGQLGNEIIELNGAAGAFRVVATDVDTLDITDYAAVLAAARAENAAYIVNCAAYTAVDKAEGDPDAARRVNAEGPAVLARVAAETGAALVHISTDYVFDGQSAIPYKEDDPTSPLGIYGLTKLDGERAVRLSGCRGIIIRTAWLYSAYGNNFVKTMLRLGGERETVRVVDDQFGSPTYAADLAAAILSILPHIGSRRGEVYHYSNAGQTSWAGFAAEAMRQAGLAARVEGIPTSEYPTPARRPKYSLLDKTKIITDFKLDIPSWEESLRVCIKKLTAQ